MLVLSRKPGEEVVVGDNIRVMVVDIRGDKVRLGFTAPTEVPIHRDEVYKKIHQTSQVAEHRHRARDPVGVTSTEERVSHCE